MLKRLIEVALPLKEVSEHSAREKSIRHGHISTLHIWWARRPLAACRAAIFASLIPDPDDPECPEEFRTAVKEILGRSQFKPKNGNGSTVEDTPRNRCLQFIKHLVRWENSNNPEYIEPARKLIAAAHPLLHPDARHDTPRVLDSFAGGGAIPLEALRLGCESHAVDLNPVAHLIELCTLVYPQKYGQPDSRPVPDYIKRLATHARATRRAMGETHLFDEDGSDSALHRGEIVPDVGISEEEYRSNPLAADLRYWGAWVFERARQALESLYRPSHSKLPAAFLWARTAPCPNPTCRKTIPLIQQLWLAKTPHRRVAVRMHTSGSGDHCTFEVVEEDDIDFDADTGTLSRNAAVCPSCDMTIRKKVLEDIGNGNGFGTQLIAVVELRDSKGKHYRAPTDEDLALFAEAAERLDELRRNTPPEEPSVVPDEPLPYLRSIFNCHVYGFRTWGSLYNPRQALALATFMAFMKEAGKRIHAEHGDEEYAIAIRSLLGCVMDRFANRLTTLSYWFIPGEKIQPTFVRQALAMVWDHVEACPLSDSSGSWQSPLIDVVEAVKACSLSSSVPAVVLQGSATSVPIGDNELDAVVTDPPYYDSVPYADLSDFFYVLLKRCLLDVYPALFRSPLTPKRQEAVQLAERNRAYKHKTKEFFEEQLARAFIEAHRTIHDNGVVAIMFAHKTTAAWETLVGAVTTAGLTITASWPLHTELKTRLRSRNSAALASSVTLVCRKRTEEAGDGLWDDVRQELKAVAKERLDFFWDQGIRGADFFISAIGPALSVYGRYARVIRISGEEVTVGEFLDEVRSLVTNYALTKILHTKNTANIDPESRFYVVWKWSYGDAKVPADESFKLAQALGIDTEEMWDKTGVLTKSGENVQCLPVEKRMKVKDLGEPEADGTPASLIDVLHRMCVFRDKGDNAGMAQFLGRSGQARNPALWLIAQAVSEILPDGEREKQLMQGLLNQQEGLEEATRQGELF